MQKLSWLGILMLVAILGITGFQLYWLKQNYEREEKSLGIRSEMNFRESVLQLQVTKLKLNPRLIDSTHENVRVFMKSDDDQPVRIQFRPRKEIVSTINLIREKITDSIKRRGPGGMVIAMNKESVDIDGDSLHIRKTINDVPGNKIFDLLYGVDSLQDSLRITEIDSAFQQSLRADHINVPYSINVIDSSLKSELPAMDEVTVGLVHPVTYKMKLGNTAPYLLRRIMLPIIFSVLLLAITILSFLLLYRNLLRQKRLAALKNEFISNITHELKTPIATVGVAIEALKNFNALDDPMKTKEYLDISSNELHRLGLLVDKVLKLSMFEKKEVELKPELLQLDDLVDEVVNSLRLQLEKHRSTITIHREGDLNLRGDRLHLLSVIFNLVDNAIKYSSGPPVIHIDMHGNATDIIMKITDQGIGIPSSYQDKIFEKFFRVPHGDTHNAKGYGLGLSYAAQVIQKHNGSITVKSEPGQQTSFTIILPKQLS